MNILEMYKRLSKEDKSHLTVYCIYDSIYDVARNENTEISKKEFQSKLLKILKEKTIQWKI